MADTYSYANVLGGIFSKGLGEWKEPERPEEYNTPSKRRSWRLYCAYDRAHHDAINAEYEATKADGEGFMSWAQEKINRQMTERLDALYLDTAKKLS